MLLVVAGTRYLMQTRNFDISRVEQAHYETETQEVRHRGSEQENVHTIASRHPRVAKSTEEGHAGKDTVLQSTGEGAYGWLNPAGRLIIPTVPWQFEVVKEL